MALPGTSMFATGDVRGNENLELTALQTLFMRNHNRIARPGVVEQRGQASADREEASGA